MSRHFFSHILLSAFICGMVLPVAALADEPASQNQNDNLSLHEIVQGPHVEGHIAFLHAELGITPAQEPLWAPVADAMREDVENVEEADRDAGNGHPPESAIQYLKNRVMFANLRAQGENRFLVAFSPLYDRLSAKQKAIADELLIPQQE